MLSKIEKIGLTIGAIAAVTLAFLCPGTLKDRSDPKKKVFKKIKLEDKMNEVANLMIGDDSIKYIWDSGAINKRLDMAWPDVENAEHNFNESKKDTFGHIKIDDKRNLHDDPKWRALNRYKQMLQRRKDKLDRFYSASRERTVFFDELKYVEEDIDDSTIVDKIKSFWSNNKKTTEINRITYWNEVSYLENRIKGPKHIEIVGRLAGGQSLIMPVTYEDKKELDRYYASIEKLQIKIKKKEKGIPSIFYSIPYSILEKMIWNARNDKGDKYTLERIKEVSGIKPGDVMVVNTLTGYTKKGYKVMIDSNYVHTLGPEYVKTLEHYLPDTYYEITYDIFQEMLRNASLRDRDRLEYLNRTALRVSPGKTMFVSGLNTTQKQNRTIGRNVTSFWPNDLELIERWYPE